MRKNWLESGDRTWDLWLDTASTQTTRPQIPDKSQSSHSLLYLPSGTPNWSPTLSRPPKHVPSNCLSTTRSTKNINNYIILYCTCITAICEKVVTTLDVSNIHAALLLVMWELCIGQLFIELHNSLCSVGLSLELCSFYHLKHFGSKS